MTGLIVDPGSSVPESGGGEVGFPFETWIGPPFAITRLSWTAPSGLLLPVGDLAFNERKRLGDGFALLAGS